jgi:hypothetical protein
MTVPDLLLSPHHPWTLLSSTRAIWLGHLAVEGQWRQWPLPLPSAPSPPLSLVSTIANHCRRYLKSPPIVARSQCHLPCRPFSTNPLSVLTSLEHNNTPTPFTNTQVYPPIAQSPPPRSPPESYLTHIESLTCSPSVAIVGFMQSGVPAIHTLLSSHPQVLVSVGPSVPSVDGERYSCYRTDTGMRYVAISLRPRYFC